jgi:predicted nucleic acid-binding protein
MAVTRALRQFLRRHRVIAADTMVFIYHLQDHPRYAATTLAILDAWESGSVEGVTSVISLAEVLVKPLREKRQQAADDYRRLLRAFPNLRLLALTADIAEEAARLRALHGLALPDMIQIASAIAEGAGGFITNDPALQRITEIEVLLLDNVCPERGR